LAFLQIAVGLAGAARAADMIVKLDGKARQARENSTLESGHTHQHGAGIEKRIAGYPGVVLVSRSISAMVMETAWLPLSISNLSAEEIR